MNGGVEHRESAEALGAYALGALPAAEEERVQGHLVSCAECRAELDWLRGAVDALPASVPPVQPPPELKARVMKVVEAEADLLRAAGAAADVPQAPARRRRVLGGRAWRPAVALALACVIAAVVVLATRGGARVIRARISPPGAQASLLLGGSSAKLVVARWPVPPANHVDELWIQRGRAAPQPAGTFVLGSGSVELARPVKSGDLVLATVERGRGTAAPTTPPILVVRA